MTRIAEHPFFFLTEVGYELARRAQDLDALKTVAGALLQMREDPDVGKRARIDLTLHEGQWRVDVEYLEEAASAPVS